MTDDPFEIANAEKQLLDDFEEKRGAQLRSEASLNKIQSKSRKKPKLRILGFSFANLINAPWS